MTTPPAMDPNDLPQPPKFEASDWEECATSGDYRRIAFEWYKYVAQVGAVVAHVDPRSPCIAAVPSLRWAVWTGLINRCVRLMFSNVFMASKRPFRETTEILDRCIFESCVKLMWLCNKDHDDRLRRFFATSLDTDVELKKEIEQAIAKRNGTVLQIERRMLDSIAEFVSSAGMTDDEVKNTKKLPDLKQMLVDIGMPSLAYAAFQKQGSHNVHGTWVSLRRDYLEPDDDGRLLPGGADHPMHLNQMLVVPRFLLRAMRGFANAVVKDGDDAIDAFVEMFDEADAGLQKIEDAAVGTDFDPEPSS